MTVRISVDAKMPMKQKYLRILGTGELLASELNMTQIANFISW